MNRMLTLGAVSLMALGMGACTGVMVDDSPGPRYSYFDGDFEYATRDGAIVTVITGPTFGMPKDRFDSMVLANMQGQNPGPPARFVAQPERGGTDPAFKVVVAFNAAKYVSGWEMCKHGDKTPTEEGAGRNAEMAIAFCIGDTPKSDAFGVAYGVSRADDAQFATLVRQVTRAIVPIGDNLEQGESDPVP